MRKKIFTALFGISVLGILVACGRSEVFDTIEFGEYNIPLKFEADLVQTWFELSEYQSQWILTMTEQSMENETESDLLFTDSLVVIDTREDNLENFIISNSEQFGSSNYAIDSSSDGKFDCGNREISYELMNIETNLSSYIVYNSQFIFENDSIFIVSYVTNDIEKHKQFSKDIKNIYCDNLDN